MNHTDEVFVKLCFFLDGFVSAFDRNLGMVSFRITLSFFEDYE